MLARLHPQLRAHDRVGQRLDGVRVLGDELRGRVEPGLRIRPAEQVLRALAGARLGDHLHGVVGLELGHHRIAVDDRVDFALLDRRDRGGRGADADDRHVVRGEPAFAQQMIDHHVRARARRADADLHALQVLRRLVAVGDALRDRDGERRIAHLHDEVLQLLALRRHGERVGIGARGDVARSAHQRLQRLRAARERRDLDLQPLVGEILALLRDDQRQIRQAERGGRDVDLALLRCRLRSRGLRQRCVKQHGQRRRERDSWRRLRMGVSSGRRFAAALDRQCRHNARRTLPSAYSRRAGPKILPGTDR